MAMRAGKKREIERNIYQTHAVFRLFRIGPTVASGRDILLTRASLAYFKTQQNRVQYHFTIFQYFVFVSNNIPSSLSLRFDTTLHFNSWIFQLHRIHSVTVRGTWKYAVSAVAKKNFRYFFPSGDPVFDPVLFLFCFSQYHHHCALNIKSFVEQ